MSLSDINGPRPDIGCPLIIHQAGCYDDDGCRESDHVPEPDREFARHYEEFGFALLAGALNPAEIGAVNDELLRLCRGDYGPIRCGYPAPGDAPAVDIDPGDTDDELIRRYLCIHFRTRCLPLRQPRWPTPHRGRADQVIGPNVKAMQSMLFIKSEGKPGQAWHQDEFFIPTRDRSLTAAWIALDDATVENGCLWVLPGSHRRGRHLPGSGAGTTPLRLHHRGVRLPYPDDRAVPVEIPAGTALIFNGYLLHRSLQNSGRHGYRRALANHYMSAESLLPWRPPPTASTWQWPTTATS